VVRRFFRDSAIYFLPTALSTGTSFVTFPLFAHHFAPHSYGILDLLSFASMLAILTVALEIYQGVGRYVSGETNIEVARAYSSTALWWTIACYIVFASITIPFAAPISSVLLGSSALAPLLRIAVAWTAAQGIWNLTASQLRWLLRPRAAALTSSIAGLTSPVAALLLVFVAHLGVRGVLWGQLLGCVVGALLTSYCARDVLRFRFDVGRWKQMIRYSSPLVFSNAGVFLNLYADRIVLQHLRSVADVGVYGVANRIAALVTVVMMGFQAAASPLFLSRRDDPDAPAAIARIFRLFSAVAAVMVLALSVLAVPLVSLFAGAAYQRAAAVVPFLVISVLFANMYAFTPGLAIAERTRTVAKLTVIAGVTNLVLALLLVAPLGTTGAGIATAATSVGWFAALMRASNRHYPVPHRWSGLVQATAIAVVLIAVAFALLPESRSEAFAPATLAVRFSILLVGASFCVGCCIGREEARALARRFRRRRGARFASRRPVGSLAGDRGPK
jgi:O-antigen/teichoic acid export membrane protein